MLILKKQIKCGFICSLTLYWSNKKYITSLGIIKGTISKKQKVVVDLAMIQYLFQMEIKLTFGQMLIQKKSKIDHRYKAFTKIKKFF